MTYYMTETTGVNCYKEDNDEIIQAESLTQAKRIASKKQFFAGTVLNLFSDSNQSDLISSKVDGKWQDEEEYSY